MRVRWFASGQGTREAQGYSSITTHPDGAIDGTKSKQIGEYANAAAQLSGEVRSALEKEAKDDKETVQQEQQALRQVSSEMNANAEIQASLGEEKDKLDEKQDQLKIASVEARNALKSMQLPMLTNSPQATALDNRFYDLMSKLSASKNEAKAESFLELPSAATPPTSLAQISSLRDDELDERIHAIKLFKDDLDRQNEKLAHQNRKLEEGYTLLRRNRGLPPASS